MSFTKRINKHFGFVIQESGGGGGSGAVDSVNGMTGNVFITKASVALGAVDNTSDINKPVSSAQQIEFDKKAEKVVVGSKIIASDEGTLVLPTLDMQVTSEDGTVTIYKVVASDV